MSEQSRQFQGDQQQDEWYFSRQDTFDLNEHQVVSTFITCDAFEDLELIEAVTKLPYGRIASKLLHGYIQAKLRDSFFYGEMQQHKYMTHRSAPHRLPADVNIESVAKSPVYGRDQPIFDRMRSQNQGLNIR